MSTEIKHKRISDFPLGTPEDVELFARTANGSNARVPYSVKQTPGTSTTATMSQDAISRELAKRDEAIEAIKIGSIGVITSPDDSIEVDNTISGVSIGVKTSTIVAPKQGLQVVGNRIGILIDPSENNRITITQDGALLVESENFWQTI